MESLKSGIFDGPQVRELMKDPMFDGTRSEDELSTWQSPKLVASDIREKTAECKKREGNWRATEEFLPIQGVQVSQTVLSPVTLG